LYTHPCTDHVVEVTILYQYPDSNLDVEYYIYNNITTQFGFGTFIIDDDYLSEQICLLDGCYRIYMSPQGQMQEILWEIKVDGLITLVSESYDTYINFSVGTRVCNSGGCNNQQACNFSPYDMSTSDCCYECTEVELAQGQIPGITQWEVRSTNANAQLEASGDALFNGAVCFDIQAFTTYELRMSDSEGNGWNGATLTLSYSDWNWSFSETLETGAYESVFFTTGGFGCTDPNSCNYNDVATIDDGNCLLGAGSEIVLQMTDANSNSWGNYHFEIKNSDEEIVQSGTHTGGPISSVNFCLTEDCYTINPSGNRGGAWQIGWTLSYPDSTIIASGGAPSNTSFGFDILGNLNNDCSVNIGDLLEFITEFPCSSNCGAADLNSDGYTNLTDLLIFVSRYGTTY